MNNEKQALVPRLRFPGFRDVWCSSPMSERYSFRGNNSLSRDKLNYSEGSLRNIHYGDIHTKFALHFRVDAELVPYINDGESHSAIRPENYCMPGDVVFADASEDMEDIGKAIEVIDTGDVPLVCGLHTILARPDTANFALGFGAYLFSSEGTRKQIQREAQGAKVLGLSASRLGNVKLHYPRSTREQQKIADCLSSLDALISAQADKLDALKTHKKGLMQQLLPRESETVPRLRFPEFWEAGEWEECRLEELAKRGSGHTPNKKISSYYNGGIKWVSLADSNRLDNGCIYNTKIEISQDGLDNSSAVLHPAGTVILSRDAGVGKSAILYSQMAVSQHFMAWQCHKSKLSNWFLYYVLQKMKSSLEVVAVGNTIKTIGVSYFREMMVLVPSLSEQQKIADCLSSLDVLITAQADKLDALKIHKKGLMQQLFPGPEA